MVGMKFLGLLVGGGLVLGGGIPQVRADPLQVREDASGIEIRRGDALVLRYHKVPPPEAAAHPAALARSGHLHPVLTPSGKVVTDDLSPEHPHQHGVFFAWTKTSFEGREPEFWNEHLGAGKVRHVRTVKLREEDGGAGFEVEHRFDDLTAPGGPRAALTERWIVFARHEGRSHVIELESRQRCAGPSPVEIRKYHYGGMAFRGSSRWLNAGDDLMRTSAGHGRVEGNHTRPEWVTLRGEIDGAPCGVRITPHPENFRHPQWVRLHPSLPYFVFSPMVEEPFVIAPGEDYVSRFRLEVFDGPEPGGRLSPETR
jgi:hypothetical protein